MGLDAGGDHSKPSASVHLLNEKENERDLIEGLQYSMRTGRANTLCRGSRGVLKLFPRVVVYILLLVCPEGNSQCSCQCLSCVLGEGECTIKVRLNRVS